MSEPTTEQIIGRLKSQGIDFDKILKDCRRQASEAEERLFQEYGTELDRAKANERPTEKN